MHFQQLSNSFWQLSWQLYNINIFIRLIIGISVIYNHSTCLIIFFTSMQGFKGLLPRQVLTDQAFQPVFKKAEEHRKAAQLCIDFFQQINKFFQSFSIAVEKCVQQCDIQNVRAPYYSLIGFVCTKMLLQNKQLTQNTKQSSKQLTKLCNAILEDFSKYLMSFQGNLRKYQENELIIQQLCKKYYRSHKNMLASIQAYKNTLTDATLIYNEQQKIKRYQTCQSNYKLVSSEFTAICEKSEVLTERKVKIVSNYEQFKTEYTKVIKMIGAKVIEETKNFINYYCMTNKSVSTFLAEQKYNLEKQKLYPFFSDIENSDNLQIFYIDQIPERAGKSSIPMIFEYPQFIKDEYLQTYNSQMLNYLRKIQQNVEKRKQENKRIYQLFIQYFKTIEKVHILGVKQIMKNFQQLKKKLVESFGPRLASFMKSINSIFELLSGINEKLVKNINVKLAQILSFLNEESKILKLFGDELKTNIEKCIGKKQLKKIKQQDFTQQASVVNITNFRKQSTQKAQFFKHLILGFQQKMGKNSEKISKGYTNIVHDLSQSINQFYSFCCEYQSLYFGPEQFQKNFKIYQSDVDALIQKNKKNFEQLPLHILKGDNSKIVFDGQFAKAEQFKKLKKPVVKEQLAQKESFQQEIKKQVEQPKSPKALSVDDNALSGKKQEQLKGSESLDLVNRKSSLSFTSSADEKEVKNVQFLLTKIQLKENQQYIKSFSCALSSKIVLHGRMYITSERICFSSSFNENNLFFGGTFIQFPKKDIIKIEKKQNALLLDLSISFTTVKGELSFTSFFSRNEAYDLVCKTYQISLDEHVYEIDENQKEAIPQSTVVEQVRQDDDIKDDELESRKLAIEQAYSKFKYVQAVTLEVSKDRLNALQIFKTFYANNEITINRRKYPNFLTYLKQVIDHKDLQIDDWDPSLSSLLNKSNIKSGSPIKLNRKIRVTVPVANSGVPFMPKTAKSQQIQTLHFYSKHKWVLDAEISTTGAPYTDTFKVQLRTLVTSEETGKCNISIGFFVNFLKNTMMKSMIESKSAQQTVKASKAWTQQMRKYITSLIKSQQQRSIKKASQNPVQQLSKLQEQLEQKQKQLDKITQQKQETIKQIQKYKTDKQKSKKIIIALIIFNVLLLLLLVR